MVVVEIKFCPNMEENFTAEGESSLVQNFSVSNAKILDKIAPPTDLTVLVVSIQPLRCMWQPSATVVFVWVRLEMVKLLTVWICLGCISYCLIWKVVR